MTIFRCISIFNIDFIFKSNKHFTMTGEEIRLKLLQMGIQQQDLAEKLGMSKQNFSAALKVKSVKSDFIESLCKLLGLSIGEFYSEHPQPVQKPVEEMVSLPKSVIQSMTDTISSQQRTIEELSKRGARAVHQAGNAGCADAI